MNPFYVQRCQNHKDIIMIQREIKSLVSRKIFYVIYGPEGIQCDLHDLCKVFTDQYEFLYFFIIFDPVDKLVSNSHNNPPRNYFYYMVVFVNKFMAIKHLVEG